MAGGLKELRRAAGFASARQFAESHGISAATYTRYEKDPGHIPIRAAWELADALGVTIDQIVGRGAGVQEKPEVEVQRAFDSLSPRSQEELLDLIEVFRQRDERDRRNAAMKAEAYWELLESRIERCYLDRLDAGEGKPDPLLLTGTSEELRSGFESLAREWLIDTEAPMNPYAQDVRGEGAVAAVMDAYDRMHGSYTDDGGMTISWTLKPPASGRGEESAQNR
jgi:transcriptional regulator with XRE-family HTH domain